MPADDLTDPAPATTFAHLDAPRCCRASIAEMGIYPAVDPLDSTLAHPAARHVVGDEHYEVARGVQQVLQRYKDLQDIIAILGMDELSDEDKLIGAARAQDRSASCRSRSSWPRRSPAPPGKYVQLEDTIRGFQEILDGKHDDLPEQAFYMVGSIDEAVEAAPRS